MTTGDPANRSWEHDTQPVPPLDVPSPAMPAAAPPAATPPSPATPPPSAPAWGSASRGTPPARPSGPPGSEVRGDRRGTLILGIFLVLLGTVFLATRVARLDFGEEVWPLWIIAVGAALLIASLTIRNRGGLGLAVPGGIVLTAGVVLWVQNSYDLYQTWAYAWALVAPGGIGLGMLIHGVATGNAESRGDGLQAILTGLGLFAGLALFFEGVVGLSGGRIPGLEDALPFLVIGMGVVILAAAFLNPRGRART